MAAHLALDPALVALRSWRPLGRLEAHGLVHGLHGLHGCLGLVLGSGAAGLHGLHALHGCHLVVGELHGFHGLHGLHGLHGCHLGVGHSCSGWAQWGARHWGTLGHLGCIWLQHNIVSNWYKDMVGQNGF